MNRKERTTRDPFKATDMSPKDLAVWRAQLAKTANVRLKALETAKSKVTGEHFTYGAYQRYAADVLGMEKPRFSESRKAGNVQTMRKEIRQLQQFLNAKSSTIRGNREIEAARIATFKSGEWGRFKGQEGEPKQRSIGAATNAEFYEFLNSGLLDEKINPYFSSDKMIEFYELAHDKGMEHDDIIDRFEKAFADFQAKKAKGSIEEIEKRLGIKWLD